MAGVPQPAEANGIKTEFDPGRFIQYFQQIPDGRLTLLPVFEAGAGEAVAYHAWAFITQGDDLLNRFTQHGKRLISAIEQIVSGLEIAKAEAQDAERPILTTELSTDLALYRSRLEKERARFRRPDRFGRGEYWAALAMLAELLRRTLRREPSGLDLHHSVEAARFAIGNESKSDAYDVPGDRLLKGLRHFEEKNPLAAAKIRRLPDEALLLLGNK